MRIRRSLVRLWILLYDRSSSNFNLWRGLRITRQAALAVRPTQSSCRELQRAIQPFLDHIRVIWCREDAEAYA